MSSRHPVDRHGRALPDSSWPDDRHAPGRLELVRRFCNTANLESGADRLGSSEDFDAWLVGQGAGVLCADAADLDRCLRLREALRAACASHRAGVDDGAALADLVDIADDVRFHVGTEPDGFGLVVDPLHSAVDRFLGELVLAVHEARSADTWDRLKACRSCRWVVYDDSRNRSTQWCSMSACGGRAKVRAHRARLADRTSTRTRPDRG